MQRAENYTFIMSYFKFTDLYIMEEFKYAYLYLRNLSLLIYNVRLLVDDYNGVILVSYFIIWRTLRY